MVNKESVLKEVREYDRVVMLLLPKNIKSIFLAVLLIKSCALMIDLANQLFSTEERIQFINILQRFLKSIVIVEK